jgi:arylsulfatase A-like enzyme
MTLPINLIVIKADELRHDSLSCAGNRYLPTPNIDRLAALSRE